MFLCGSLLQDIGQQSSCEESPTCRGGKKARNKIAPGRLLVPGHQKGTFSFSSVSLYVCPCPKGLPCFTEVDIKAVRAAPASPGPTYMHLFYHISFSCYHRDSTMILPITVAFFTDHFRMMLTSSGGQNGSLTINH